MRSMQFRITMLRIVVFHTITLDREGDRLWEQKGFRDLLFVSRASQLCDARLFGPRRDADKNSAHRTNKRR